MVILKIKMKCENSTEDYTVGPQQIIYSKNIIMNFIID